MSILDYDPLQNRIALIVLRINFDRKYLEISGTPHSKDGFPRYETRIERD